MPRLGPTGVASLVSILKNWTNSLLNTKANASHTHTKEDITDLPAIPTKVSDLTNDSGFLTTHNPVDSALSSTSTNAVQNKVINSALADKASSTHTHSKSDITDFPTLATVATSGSYNDLSNKPTIPTVNDKTLTIQKNGTSIATFTANSNKDVSANITVPTKVSELTNDSGFLTAHQSLADYSTKADTIKDLSISGKVITYTKGDDTTGTLTTQDTVYTHPTSAGNKHIPSGGSANQYLKYSASGTAQWATIKTSELNNDSGFLTSHNPVDSALSDTSTNAVQNKVVKDALDGKSDTGHTHTKSEITDFPTLATVATSGSYNDLTNKPTIPTVNNATLTIQKNGTTVKTFTANASSNVTANIAVPTKVSELTNDSGYLTSTSSLDSSKLTGTIDIARLPKGALERLVTVADQTARFALTTSDVQLGDTVKQLDTGMMYIITDESKLSSADGYTEYTAGAATSVPWSGVTGKPSSYTPASHSHGNIANGGTLGTASMALITDGNKKITTSSVTSTELGYLSGVTSAIQTQLNGKAASSHTHTASDVSGLATVATSGSYNDLSNKPTIPTVNNATLTIQRNGTTVKTFTANASSNVTANITVPTKTSDLTNDSHQTITVGTDTTSTASPAHSGTFTCIDSVTRDSNGHVTAVNTKTVTLPADNNTDTKVTNTLGTTTKAYVTGTTSATTNTGTQIFDTGVYLSTTAGELVATKFTGALNGNAATATQFSANKDVALTGDVTGTASSKGGWSVATTLANSGVTAGSYGPSKAVSPAHGGTFSVPYVTVDAKGRVTAASTITITLPADSNTDTLMTQSVSTANNTYPILLCPTANATANQGAKTGIFGANALINPSTGEITSKSNGIGAFRVVGGNYGFFIRNDGTNTYFLLTASGDQYGTWTSARPLTINDSTGVCSINGNAATATQFSANKNVTLTGYVNGTASSKAGWSIATALKNCYFHTGGTVTNTYFKVASGILTGGWNRYETLIRFVETTGNASCTLRIYMQLDGSALFDAGYVTVLDSVNFGTNTFNVVYKNDTDKTLFEIYYQLTPKNHQVNALVLYETERKLVNSCDILTMYNDSTPVASLPSDYTLLTTEFELYCGDLVPAGNNKNLGSSDAKWSNAYATTFIGNLTGNVTGDVSGNCSGSSGSCTGNAATATQFSSNATVTLTGDATGTSAGSKKSWSVPVTLANSGVTAGTYGPSADVTGNNNSTISVPQITVDAKGRVTSVVNRTLTCKNNTYSVYNKTLTIQKNGTNVATFTSNSNTDVTANITVPTKTSELTNDSGFLTSHQSLSNYLTKTTNVSEMGRYIDLHYDNATSKYDYDARLYVDSQGTAAGGGSFKIAAASAYAPAPASNANDTRIATTAWVNSKGYITSSSDITGTSANVTGTVAIANGGTGATTRLGAVKNLTSENVGTGTQYFLTITSNWGKAGYCSVADAKTVLGLGSAAYTASTAYAAASHTHSNYSTLENTIKSLSISGRTITYTKGDNTTGTLTTQDNNTWTAMVGATSSANGSVGYVNAVPPKDGYNTKYLRADGTWAVPPDHTYTVNNATLTIQKNGTNVATFTSNASANATANITVPTKVSELTNDSGFLTSHQSLSNYVTLNTTQTISGIKSFSTHLRHSSTNTRGTAPSANESRSLIDFRDSAGNSITRLLSAYNTDRSSFTGLHAYNTAVATGGSIGSIGIGCTVSGLVYTVAPTPAASDASTQIATTEWVKKAEIKLAARKLTSKGTRTTSGTWSITGCAADTPIYIVGTMNVSGVSGSGSFGIAFTSGTYDKTEHKRSPGTGSMSGEYTCQLIALVSATTVKVSITANGTINSVSLTAYQ